MTTRREATPLPGDRVRLVALRGVSSPAMRDQLGRIGTISGTRRMQDGGLRVAVAFPRADGTDDVFWLKAVEYELVDAPTAADGAGEEAAG